MAQSLIYYKFLVCLIISAISKKAHMQAHLFLFSMHVNYTLIANHPPKSKTKHAKMLKLSFKLVTKVCS